MAIDDWGAGGHGRALTGHDAFLGFQGATGAMIRAAHSNNSSKAILVIDSNSLSNIPTERAQSPQGATPTVILEPTDKAARYARAFVAGIFAKWGFPDDYLARLVVSELVTNAYRHGQGAIIVRLSIGVPDGLPLIEVYDAGERLPAVLPENHAATGGRGLPTIAHVTSAWGVRRVGQGGKVVWARLLT
ncbi:ATP-binding protein [Actinomadura sp. 21ATH]|uniref:ATP-binding protein n=1 Tax=Actinomadura sp. 21ATH TaxID=1735444 RepID=UPI0035C00FF0